MSSQQIFSLPVSFDSYIRNGWRLVPIPPNTKGPASKDWNLKEKCLTSSADIPPGWGAGLAHAYNGTMALDIDNLEDGIEFLSSKGIDLQALLNAPDAVTIESGVNGHAKLIYKMPFGLALNSKKLMKSSPDGKRYNYLDFRCSTRNELTVQDVLPPSIHPDTLQPYRWGGAGRYDRVPTIPDKLLFLWQSLLTEEDHRPVTTAPVTPGSTSWADIVLALNHIDPDIDRTDWVNIGMALHHAGTTTDNMSQAFDTFNHWSSQGKKYRGVREIETVWRSFNANDGITIATMFHLAVQAGWKRAIPPVAELFSKVENNPEPQMILDKINLRTKPPVCDLTLFPDILARRAKEVGYDVGCDPVVPLLAGLSAICAVVDSRTRLHVTSSWSVPPVLWLMTIGGSSDKKSPGTRPMVSILDKIQREDAPRFKVEQLLWKAQEARYVSQLKAYQQHHSDIHAELANTPAPVVSEMPAEPKNVRLTINDATSQMVIRLAEGRPRGFLMLLDEMEHWLNRVNNPHSGDDRGCWIQGYETGAYTADRVGAGTMSAENMAVAIYGNVQPKVFRDNIEIASKDGLMQRFIPVTVDWEKTTLWQDTPDYMTSKGEFDDLCRSLFALPATDYNMTPEAKEAFREFSKWYLELRRAEMLVRSGDTYMTALGKSEGTCLRLALIFHMIETPHAPVVSVETMNKAINCMKKFFIPSMRYAFIEIAKQGCPLTEWVVEHIIQISSVKETVKLADIKRVGRRQTEGLSNAQADMEIRNVMVDLEEAGYVIMFDNPDPRNIVWAINPNLANLFSEYRQEIIAAKQKMIDIFNDHALKVTGKRGTKTAIGYVPEEK